MFTGLDVLAKSEEAFGMRCNYLRLDSIPSVCFNRRNFHRHRSRQMHTRLQQPRRRESTLRVTLFNSMVDSADAHGSDLHENYLRAAYKGK